MRALSIRQPYVELILRGIKTIEYRSRPTRIVDERFYLYASKTPARLGTHAWSTDLAMPNAMPAWLAELATQMRLIPDDVVLPTGMLVGSARIDRVSQIEEALFCWHLADVERLQMPKRPTRHPQPAWFQPF